MGVGVGVGVGLDISVGVGAALTVVVNKSYLLTYFLYFLLLAPWQQTTTYIIRG